MSELWKFALPYGDLESLLSNLVGAEPTKVRSRYRKLRLRPFPDDIQSGTGVRVKYNLRRVLAIAAVFQLNNLYVAQGHAASIVEAAWPELCRALLVAANDCALLPSLENKPALAGPILEIGCFAISAGNTPFIDTATVREIDVQRLAIRPSLAFNLTQLLQALSCWADERGGVTRQSLIHSLRELEADYGWGHITLADGHYSDVLVADSFLADGPFLNRSLMLLEATPSMFDPQASPAARLRLQSIYTYLESPAPIDAAKAALGLSKDERLERYLHFYARAMGLATKEIMPAIWNLEDPQIPALHIVRMALSEASSQSSPSIFPS